MNRLTHAQFLNTLDGKEVAILWHHSMLTGNQQLASDTVRRWYIHALLKRITTYIMYALFVLVCCIEWDATLTNFGF